jgi:Flp pilus assembly protein TadD
LILQPGLFVARDLRGWVKLKQGNAPAAIAEFTAVLASRPTYAASLYGRGLARQRNGDADGAADLAAARKLDPEIKTRVARYGF